MAYGLYVHIPYCRSRCRYCDFYTAGGSRAVPEEYIQALLRDFQLFAPKSSGGRPCPPETVYFGGGTPSLLSAEQVRRLLHAFAPEQGAEITLEANPESAGVEQLRGWRQAGVNRLSVGVQTALDSSLQRLGRLHTAEQARRALYNAVQAGFTNISGDIMMALPQYTREEFDETLALLHKGGAVHISAYLLKLEEGTAFGNAPPQGMPDGDAAADFYLYGVQRMEEQGYAQYEISNFAKPGMQSRHNLIYWDCQSYLGLGPGAHSCMEEKRFFFPPDTPEFITRGGPPVPDGASGREDYIMLRLRLTEGLEEAELRRRYGSGLSQSQQKTLQGLAAHGLARKTPQGWALTPQGLLVQNSILLQLL